MESADHPEPARRALPDDGSATPTVGLSTSAVFPDSTGSAFQLAAQLGYDGIELMVGTDAASADLDQVRQLRDEYQVPVLSVHSPCLVITSGLISISARSRSRKMVARPMKILVNC